MAAAVVEAVAAVTASKCTIAVLSENSKNYIDRTALILSCAVRFFVEGEGKMKYVEVGQKSQKGQNVVSSIIIFLFGSALLMIALYVHKTNKDFFETAVPTQGTITKIKSNNSSTHSTNNAKKNPTVYVSYKIDGETYESTLGYYTSGMRVGDSAEVWYRPDNPHKIKSKEATNFGIWILGAMGVIFLVLGVLAFIQTVTGKGETDDGN